MRVRVSSKGQIVLPAAIREKYDASPGAEWVLVDMGTYVALVPKSKDPIREAHGMFAYLGGEPATETLFRMRREEHEREEAKIRRWLGEE